MAKGQVSKQEIMANILQTFPGSFLYNDNKEIRINMVENGEPVQIKITLTAAKTAVEPGEDVAVPGEVKATKVEIVEGSEPTFEKVNIIEPTAQELNNVSALMESLGF